jgi:predicted ATPase/DNA-binding SARP family transcriptional activator
MSRLALYLLGSPRVELDGEEVHIGRRKALALLAYLAVEGSSRSADASVSVHSRDTLATLLWPEYDQSRARADLRRTLSLLNRMLGDEWIAADRETAGLDPNADLWLDVDAVQERLAECEGHGHATTEACAECVPLLEEAVAVYRDDFLAGFTLKDSLAFDEWQFFQTQGLRDDLARALERLVRYHGDLDEYEAAIAYARRWLALDPINEPVHRHLMALYARAGQQAAALRQYRLCEETLAEELGVPPSPETTALYEQIRGGEEVGREPEAAAGPPHNLPAQLTPFVGRVAELAELNRLLTHPDVRLVTVLGAGGMGKTRLALEAAADRCERYAHGIHFVPLAPLQSAESIVPTVAEAIGFAFYKEEGGSRAARAPRQQLLDYLRQKQMLLVMDNYEHLLDGVDLVTEILSAAPQVKVLATSRARLNLQGEQLFQLAGMSYPQEEGRGGPAQALWVQHILAQLEEDGAQHSAVQLFLTSACRAHSDFALTPDNLLDVICICRLLDGMPLGILLAAAWVAMLTPAEIAAEIHRGLDLLETEMRDLPERQRSMRAVFDHSWHLLSVRERALLQALSVFRRGFILEAAQAVGDASLRELMGLLGRSLLSRDATGRYQMHELLRQYAAEKLLASPDTYGAAHDRHCAYYVNALQEWEADLKGARQGAALEEMDREIENARAAWNWAAEQGQVQRLDRALDGLVHFYDRRLRFEDAEAICRLAAIKLGDEKPRETASGDALRVLARVLATQAGYCRELGEMETADRLLDQSLALLNDPALSNKDTRHEQALVALQMGVAAVVDADWERARKHYEHSLVLYRALGDDRWWTALVLDHLGWLFAYTGMYDEAMQFHAESLAIRRGLGDHDKVAISLLALSAPIFVLGRFEEALQLVQEAIGIWRGQGIRTGIAAGLDQLGTGFLFLGRFAEARSALNESAEIWGELGVAWGLDWRNAWLGFAELHLGRHEQARSLGQAVLASAQQARDLASVARALWLLGDVALAEEAYAKAQGLLRESVAAYRGIGLPNEMVFALADLALAARGLGQSAPARRLCYEALQTVTEIRAIASLCAMPAIVALLLADEGDAERAVELYALASRYGLVANSCWHEDVIGRHIAAASTTLPPQAVAAAQERGRARDLLETAAELLEELPQLGWATPGRQDNER